MKLVIAMGLEEHREALRGLFRDHHVLVTSEAPVTGFRPQSTSSDAGNWFASRPDGVASHAVFAFVDDAAAGALLEAVRTWNAREHSRNPIHLYQLAVDASA
jgi:hypothetical protein